MRKTLLSLLLVIALLPSLIAQNVMPIGSWRSHLPYRLGQVVTQSEDKIYYATNLSVMEWDKEDGSVDFLSKVDGLSEVGIDIIKYNNFSDILLVIYDNSVIDLVKEDDIITMNQINNFNNFVGGKEIYDIFIENDSMVYLAANFGVSKINIFANEFAFTTFTGVAVQSVRVFNDQIYAATEEGIYTAALDNINLDDFGNWTLLGEAEGFPMDYSSNALQEYRDELYADVNDTLYVWRNNTLERIHGAPGFTINYLSAEGKLLLAGFECVSSPCNRDQLVYLDEEGNVGTAITGCLGRPKNAIEDERGQIWFGDGFRNFRRLESITAETCIQETINSPYSENSREIAIYNNQVWMAAGGVNPTFSNNFSDHGFASFIDGEWSIYNRWTRSSLKGEDPNDSGDDLFDFITITIHPETGHVFAGSFYEGLMEVNTDDDIFLYNENNSSLGNAVGDGQRTRVSGLAFDSENNLWISNHSAERPISVLTAEGEWKNFAPPSCNQTAIHQMDIDENDFKWIIVGNSQAGVMVFDEGDIDNAQDDRCRIFTATNSNLPTNNTNCLTVDLDGDVWVGTTEGIVIFECGGSAFEPECQGSRRIVEQDGFGAFLLDTEDVLTIAVDGANRKWIGTKNGIFVLSPNGQEQIARFTVDNSPLFDNNVLDIAINQETGEVFIGTNKGILSYQSDAAEGTNLHSNDIIVFPNPIRPDYTGPIAIKGLARDANVKITDVNGRLVYETKALGGQAIWDGNDYNGRRANSGVYLVFSTSSPSLSSFGNPSTAVAKILFIN